MKTRSYFHSRPSRLVALFAAIMLFLLALWGLWRGISVARCYDIPPLTQSTLDELELSQTSHLMIVAHPDDETLWGGSHLQEGGYLVVCLTNGSNKTRSQEFQAVMAASGNIGLILSYPDKVAGRRDNWVQVKAQMEADITLILQAKPWETIVTHNAKGEYGHIHHKLTHQMVVGCYDGLALSNPLFCFGDYYRAADLPEVQAQLTPLSAQTIAEKEMLLSCYASQASTLDGLSHMVPYEMWQQIRGGGANAA